MSDLLQCILEHRIGKINFSFDDITRCRELKFLRKTYGIEVFKVILRREIERRGGWLSTVVWIIDKDSGHHYGVRAVFWHGDFKIFDPEGTYYEVPEYPWRDVFDGKRVKKLTVTRNDTRLVRCFRNERKT